MPSTNSATAKESKRRRDLRRPVLFATAVVEAFVLFGIPVLHKWDWNSSGVVAIRWIALYELGILVITGLLYLALSPTPDLVADLRSELTALRSELGRLRDDLDSVTENLTAPKPGENSYEKGSEFG